MIKNNILKKYLSIATLLLIIGLTSCENGELGWGTDSSYNNLFRSLTFTYYSTSTNSIGVSFTKVINASKYIIEVSEDSLEYKNIIKTKILLSDTLTSYSESTTASKTEYRVLFSNLNADTRYSVRMIAYNEDSTLATKYSEFTVATPAENIFKTIEPTADGAKFTWNKTDSASYMLVSKVSGTNNIVLKDSVVSSDELANATKTISGLEAGVYYTAKLCFLDGIKVRVRGKKTFKTTGTAGSYVYNIQPTENADTLLLNLVAKGYTNITLNFNAGGTYNLGAFTLPAGLVKLTFSSASTNHPTINLTGIVPAGSMDGFLFENVDLVGTSASYAFNLKTTDLTITTINFEGCTISAFRGILREQEAIISSIAFNNCIIKNIADYGLVNCTTTTTNKLNSYSITNCTIINCKAFINVGIKLSLIEVSYCTFYNNTASLGTLFRFSSTYLPTTLTVSYNIHSGNNNNTTLTSFYGSYTGFTDFSFSTCYKTSDLTVSTATGKLFTNINALTLSSTGLFIDPVNGNFTVNPDVTFAGKGIAGDPRWW